MIGTLLRGHYKIVKQIGSGGFGQTYLAEDIDLPQRSPCVVKLFQPRTKDPEMLKTAKRLFDLEAEVLYKLGVHPQIPRLLAHFEQDGAFYLVQDYVDGNDLSKELTKGKQMPEAEVIQLLQDILPILQFVHEAKVIHRDLKPGNVLITADGTPKLTDFGLAKRMGDSGGPTATGAVLGTPSYMAPEQASGTIQPGQPRIGQVTVQNKGKSANCAHAHSVLSPTSGHRRPLRAYPHCSDKVGALTTARSGVRRRYGADAV